MSTQIIVVGESKTSQPVPIDVVPQVQGTPPPEPPKVSGFNLEGFIPVDITGTRYYLSEGKAFRIIETLFSEAFVDCTKQFLAACRNLPKAQPHMFSKMSSIWDIMKPHDLSRIAHYLVEQGDRLNGTEAMAWWGVRRATNQVVFAIPSQEVSAGGVDADDPELARHLGENGIRVLGTVHTHPSEWVNPSMTDEESWCENQAGLHFIVGRTKKTLVPFSAWLSVISDTKNAWAACKENTRKIMLAKPSKDFEIIALKPVEELIRKKVYRTYNYHRNDVGSMPSGRSWNYHGMDWDTDYPTLPFRGETPKLKTSGASIKGSAHWKSRKERRREKRMRKALDTYLATMATLDKDVSEKELMDIIASQQDGKKSAKDHIKELLDGSKVNGPPTVLFSDIKEIRDVMRGAYGDMITVTPDEVRKMVDIISAHAKGTV